MSPVNALYVDPLNIRSAKIDFKSRNSAKPNSTQNVSKMKHIATSPFNSKHQSIKVAGFGDVPVH